MRHRWLVLALCLGCLDHGGDVSDDPDDATPRLVARAAGGHELHWVRANTCAEASPITLTASDGTGLELTRLRARAVIEGPLAFTELHLEFLNPEARQREGRFSVVLPPGASISRFAMKNGERWREAEVVERTRGHEVYESYLHQGVDPALLETDAGNAFRARVFPIEPYSRKELIVAYSEGLPRADAPYRLPLCGLPRLGELDVEVGVAPEASDVLEFRGRGVRPKMDLEVQVSARRVEGVRAGDLVVTRFAPQVDVPLANAGAWAILFDTSASQALGFEARVEQLGALVKALGRRDAEAILTVVAFDQSTQTIYQGPIRGFGPAQLDAIRLRGALGATDLRAALHALRRHGEVPDRVVIVGDGIATAGDDDLRRAVEALSDHGLRRIDAVMAGVTADAPALVELAQHFAPQAGIVADARWAESDIAHRLELGVATGVRVEVPGARWWSPRVLDGVQPGDEVLVYAEVDGTVHVNGTAPPLGEGTTALVARAVAAEKLRLEQDIGRIVELSTRHRILSEYTTMLVLESDADYRRFGITPGTHASVLRVGRAGLEVAHRQRLSIATPGGFDAGALVDGARAKRGPLPEAPPPAPPQRLGGGGGSAGGSTRSADTRSVVVYEFDDDSVNGELLGPDGALVGTGGLPPVRIGPGLDLSVDAIKAAQVQRLIDAGAADEAVRAARAWRDASPNNILALVSYGDALAAAGLRRRAARAYGSLIDLGPSRADYRRAAGERLEALGGRAHALAIDTYRKAVELRPDRINGHRLLAYALARAGRHDEAVRRIETALSRQDLPLLRDDLAMLRGDGPPFTLFVLSWETDANDVDLHVWDRDGRHGSYAEPTPWAGASLYADVTEGFGPEAFVFTEAPAWPVRVAAHYFDQGAMGVGLGALHVIRRDRTGRLDVQVRPFTVRAASEVVPLGAVAFD